ncbi:ankyrin-1-like [Mytilus californianus]|uniref:ankyrin-1-like n=1 Tax=Mytilus californianus TaxID=6549 RepID=UPI002245C531|nr:ankyrin-1-like [Mytilus californianus]
MKSKEMDFNEKIPPKIQEKYDQHIEEWKNDNEKFIVTEATKHIDDKLWADNCVLVIGRPGSGKSSIIRHIALRLSMEDKYEIIPIVLSPSNILDYHNENRKQVFIIDDFCGKLVINAQNVDVWSTQIDDVLKLIKLDIDQQNARPGFVKFLFSTNEDIFNDKVFGNRLEELTPFCCKLSEKPLKDDEKLQMIKKYISTEEANIKETMISDEVYFPLLCKISEGKTADQIVKLFSNLDDFIKQDLLSLKDTSVIQFCIITLCALFENRFNDEMLNENFKFATNKEENAFKEICAEFNLGLHKESNKMRLKEQLQSVEDTYVSKTEDYYSLIHSKVYQVAEIVCAQSFINCFIKFAPSSFIAARYRFKSTTVEKNDNVVWINEADTEKRYFNRLFMDLEEGITYSTFHNAQLCNVVYREKFCSYCKKRKEKLTELLLQIKESNKSLPLNEQSSPDENADYEDYLDFKKQYHFISHKMRKPLIESAWEGYSEIVNMLLEMECDINETDKFGRTVLFVSSYLNKTDVAKTLIESGAMHDMCNEKGQCALFIASRQGHYDIVKALLQKKASTEHCDLDGHSSLIEASRCGHKDIVEALLKSGADISKCDNIGRSPLFFACLNGRKDVANVLIRNNANVNQCNKKGLSPLSVACTKGNAHLLDILIKANADISKVDSDDRSPLFIACEEGFDNVVDIMINKGANKTQCDWQNRSPLFISCEKGYYNIVQSLIKGTSDLINLCDEESRSPLFVACEKGKVEIAKILLENGAKLNIFDNKNRSPFYAACRSGYLEVVKLLYTKGGATDDCNIWGGSPLFVASREGHFDIVEFLINLKSDASKADSNGKTPLIVACEEGNVKIVTFLIASGTDVNHCDNERRSPLHVACFGGFADIVTSLIENGADKTLCDIDEHIPLEIARKKEFNDIVELLT